MFTSNLHFCLKNYYIPIHLQSIFSDCTFRAPCNIFWGITCSKKDLFIFSINFRCVFIPLYLHSHRIITHCDVFVDHCNIKKI